MTSKPTQDETAIQEQILSAGRAGVGHKRIAAELKSRGVVGWGSSKIGDFLKSNGVTRRSRASKPMMASAAPVPLPPMPRSPDQVPEGAGIAAYDWWIQCAEQEARTAHAEGNRAGFLAAGRMAATFLEAKRKATPDAQPNPEKDDDLIAFGAQVAADFHKLIESVVA